MIKKWFLGLSLGTSLIVLSACGGADESIENENTQPETEQQAPSGGENAAQPEMPEPDLEGVPEVVAEVNGEEVSKEEFETAYTGQFQQAAMQAQMSGQEIDQDQLKNQLAESMVGQKLLVQEAENQELTASNEEVDETLEQLAQQNGLESKDEFLTALSEQGMAEDEVMSQVETQVKVDQLIAEAAGDTKPSNEELKAAYEQVKAQQEQMGSEEELPAFDELKPELEEQVKMQKENEATQTLVAELREKGDVTINL
ncbi:peptidylprolyl isomerase [Planococcus plakortidis]|uniref:peptidylprolyl isomerase n=1 Tax=Planococcus plakortidis TaxID=1038856 RepID=A0A1C7E996_9BACL|nr:SurA N-terminal domain-containing protein [Planococcus plakortidis]ANU20440.1 peptidylprolyl isomerase [Planococcus plakortidis]